MNLLQKIDYSFLVLIFALIVGCSSQKETIIYVKEKPAEIKENRIDKNKAKLSVIQGSLYDAKGDFASAIIEYMEALNYDEDPGIYYLISKNFNYLGKYSQAVENIRKAINLDPKKIAYRELLGEIFYGAFELDSASIEYEYIVKQDSTNIKAIYSLASLYKKSKPLTAIKLYRKLLDEFGPQWDILMNLIELYGTLDKSSEELKSIEDLVNLDPGNNRLKQLLAEYYIRSGKTSKAIEIYKELLESDPENVEFNRSLAEFYSRNNKTDEAIKIYRNILKNGKNLEVQTSLAFLLIKNKEYSQAEKYLYSIIESDSLKLDFKIEVGSFYYMQSDSDRSLIHYAKKIFDLIHNKYSSDSRPYLYLSALSVKEDSLGNVERYFNKFYELEEKLRTVSGIPFYTTEVGRLFLAKEDFNNAAKYLEKTRLLYNDDILILYYLGFSYSRTDQSDKSIVLFEKVLETNPTTEMKVDIFGQLGMMYEGMKNYKRSDSLYEEGLKLDSANHLLLNNYSYSLSERGLQLIRSEKMSRNALEKEPENSSYLDTYGWILYKMGKYEESEKYLKKAVGLRDATGGNGAVLNDHLGDIYFKLNDKEKALFHWKRSIEMNPDNSEVKEKVKRGGL